MDGKAKTMKDAASAAAGQAEWVSVASQWKLIRWKFLKHKLAVASLVFLSILYFVILFAEFFSPYDARAFDAEQKNTPPQRLRFIDAQRTFHLRPFAYATTYTRDPVSLRRTYVPDTSRMYPLRLLPHGDKYRLLGLLPADRHLFGVEGGKIYLLGSDAMGRDVLSRIIYGGRISLTIGLVGIAISFFLGITIGGVSGYVGGTTDLVIQRIIEFIRSVPTIPLWMGLSAALPPKWSVLQVYFGIVVILSLLGWTYLAREVRGRFMALREEDFVKAARLDGASERRIIFRYLLPSFYSYVIASLTLSVPWMILGETSLSFIGLGLRSPAISWGVLLQDAQRISVVAQTPWLLIPGLFVILTILAFNFMGDGLRDAADPYSVA